MAEDISKCDKRDFDVNHKTKGKLNTEVDGINDLHVTKRVRPILILLPLIGINIKAGKTTICQIFRMFYLFILLLIALSLIGWQLFILLNSNFAEEGSWYVGYTYQYVVVAIVYVAAFKNRNISHLLKDTLLLYSETADVDGANRRLKRRLWPLWLIITINNCVMIIMIATHSEFEYEIFHDEFTIGLFKIHSNRTDTVVTAALIIGSGTAVYFSFCLLILFGCFAILQCFLIQECFSGLNIKLNSNGDQYRQDYLCGHRKISRIVDRFNKIFHPAVLIMICIVMLNLVSLTANAIRIIPALHMYPYTIPIFDLLYLTQLVVIFVTFVIFGNEIQCEARKGTEILLESSISIESSTNEEMHNKNGQIVNLFIAQLNTSPVAISASGLFDINANLITIIISVAVTYFTLVFSTPDRSNEKVTYDLRILSNNLSLLSNELSTLSNKLSILSNNLSATQN